MITISAGTDTYGRVKKVSGTPIVTKFAMFQFLPMCPLQSFYFRGTGKNQAEGIPLVAITRSTTFVGIPLASVDKTSVLVAYARGLFAPAALLGFVILMIPAFMYLTGDRIPSDLVAFLRAVLVLFAVGVVGGLLSYCMPLTCRRERDIRRYCAELLGVAADPARVTPEASATFANHLEDHFTTRGNSRMSSIRELIIARTKIARATDVADMEKKTDQLLNELRQVEARSRT
jgi:hypothetical protein